jgi:hypothetical protein
MDLNDLPILDQNESTMMTNNNTTSNAIRYGRRYTEGAIPRYASNGNSNKKQRMNSNSSSNKEGNNMNDEEDKRKHFLERNRQAALKCRQRKKQWLANLQHRVEFLSTDNEQLQSQATMLREEVINLKTLLLAHRDCKVAQANGTTMSMIQNSVAASSSLPPSFNMSSPPPPPSSTSSFSMSSPPLPPNNNVQQYMMNSDQLNSTPAHPHQQV